ncbi:recombinase family protein [Prescottella equi]|uniref:recombinase family protein n=1 Tax=Rhodococcus hoagii TaxID=43767 RepID=UPI001F5B45F2|nr:recombinase family protein [Prescottella equi]UNQ40923.1 recombinase family protein [Prescottella equi]
MSKVVAYARVSTDKQDAENQEFALRQYMEQHDIVCDELITEVVSGTVDTKDRKMGAIIDKLEPGDTLIVSELSRVSRRFLVVMSTLQYCLSNNIKVIAVKENWVLGDDLSSQVMAFAFGIAADIERRFISQRTKDALSRKQNEGVRLGRPPGTFKQTHYKLHGKDDEIIKLLAKQVSVAALARIFDVNRKTMQSYIEAHDLRRKVVEKTPV